jgi:Ferritin-like domain
MTEVGMADSTLGAVDVDGAISDALGALHGVTRADLFRRAALGSAALLAASAAPTEARTNDVAILNYALTLEYLQDSFYSEVERIGALTGALAEQARVVGAHERAHVKAFRGVLGRQAVARPRFDFRGATEDAARFRRTAVAFEDLAVAAYKGQAPLIRKRAYLVPALAVHSVEARHAAWIRRLAGILPAATPFDEPRTRASTLEIVAGTRFIVRTESRQSPTMTG